MSAFVRGACWLRWLALGAAMLGLQASSAPEPSPLACSSGADAWWVVEQQGRWSLQHAARERGLTTPAFHVAATFAEAPAAIAAEGDRVWVVFAAAAGRREVLTGEAARNPASGLMFVRPPGLRPCASLPAAQVGSLAAVDGDLWAIAPGASEAWRLRGERWQSLPLPVGASGGARLALASAGGELWLVSADAEGRSSRWRRRGEVWETATLEVPAWASVVSGAVRLAFQLPDGSLGTVQGGAFAPECRVPSGAAPIGWGDGFAALQLEGGATAFALASLGEAGMGPFVPLQPQRSNAARWFHLPLLGVLSLGAVMAAMLVRGAAIVRGARVGTPAAPMPLARRATALVIDLAPMALASLMAFECDLEQLLVPLLWSTDLGEAMPFVAMVAGTVAFGAVEEAAGGRSLGKRLLGGAVIGEDGSAAPPWRHLLRNLLKGLVMLSPVLVLPMLGGKRRQGVPEVITGTAVVRA